jgi:hypothetical protein
MGIASPSGRRSAGRDDRELRGILVSSTIFGNIPLEFDELRWLPLVRSRMIKILVEVSGAIPAPGMMIVLR